MGVTLGGVQRRKTEFSFTETGQLMAGDKATIISTTLMCNYRRHHTPQRSNPIDLLCTIAAAQASFHLANAFWLDTLREPGKQKNIWHRMAQTNTLAHKGLLTRQWSFSSGDDGNGHSDDGDGHGRRCYSCNGY